MLNSNSKHAQAHPWCKIMKREMGALLEFESASSQEGGKLVGENLAGGTDPGGTVGGFGKNDGTKSLVNVDNGKSSCELDTSCGVHDPPLDSPSSFHASW